MKLAVTGITGLIGSRFNELLKGTHDIFGISASSGVNLLDRDTLFKKLGHFSPDVIVHFAAKTDVDQCESDKAQDSNTLVHAGVLENVYLRIDKINSEQWRRSNSAFAINVAGTKNLVDYAMKHNTKLLYISTDFVFNGKKEFYTEDDSVKAVNWYGQTKLWGEKITERLDKHLIIRPAYPYGFSPSPKRGFLRKINDLLAQGRKLALVTDHYMTPTFIDDIVQGTDFLLKKNEHGIVHVVGGSYVTPYDVGRMLVQKFRYDKNLISKTSRDEFFHDKAPRPFQLKLKNDKLEHLGFQPKTFSEGLEILLSDSSFFH